MSNEAVSASAKEWLEQQYPEQAQGATASNEQQAQEPVAWRYRFLSENGSGLWIFSLKEPVVGDTTRVTAQPLYTAPPLRDLSDEEILNLWDEEASKPLQDPKQPLREQIKASEIALSRAIIKAAREPK